MKQSLFAELKRRHVPRVAIAYAIVAWLLVQVATQVFPFFNIPDWSVRLVVVMVVLGFPIALVLAWIYEMTPEGIRRTEAADSPQVRSDAATRHVAERLNALIIVGLLLAVAVLAWRLWNSHTPPESPATTSPPTASTTASQAKTKRPPPPPMPASTIPKKSIAVLQFENLSIDKGNGLMADIGDQKVISRTSTLRRDVC